jgi:hypothetical protein
VIELGGISPTDACFQGVTFGQRSWHGGLSPSVRWQVDESFFSRTADLQEAHHEIVTFDLGKNLFKLYCRSTEIFADRDLIAICP